MFAITKCFILKQLLMYSLTQYELPTTMPINAMAFYNQIFGWTFQLKNQRIYLAINDSDETTITRSTVPETVNPMLNTIEVKDVDKMVQKIRQEGGEIVIPKMAVPGIGWLAYFKGPDEHIFSVMEPDMAAA